MVVFNKWRFRLATNLCARTRFRKKLPEMSDNGAAT